MPSCSCLLPDILSVLWDRLGTCWIEWHWIHLIKAVISKEIVIHVDNMLDQLTRSMNFIAPHTKQSSDEVFRNTSIISLYCAIAWRKGSILLRFWAVLLFLWCSWRLFTAFWRSLRVVMENLACSSGFKRFLKSSKTCLKLSSMLAIVSAPCVAVHKSMDGL